MFFPFLPFILVLAALTAIVSTPEAPPTVLNGAQVVAGWLGLLLIGWLLGRLPAADPAARSPMRLGGRRALVLGGWLLAISGLNLYPELRGLLTARGLGETVASEGAMILLLINYWLCDGLALRAPGLREGRAGLRRWSEVLRIPLPVLGLFVLAMLASRTLEPMLPAEGIPTGMRVALSMVMFGLVMVVAVPGLIRLSWGFRPLDRPDAEAVIAAELAANGIRRTPIFCWPETVMGASTAAVIGLLPPFRYLLIAPSLVTALTAEELRAVTAHEAAHVRHRHLWYYLAAIFAFVLFMQVVLDGLWVGSFLAGWSPPLWSSALLELTALLLFLRFGIGFLSRHFERQADGSAFRRHGARPLQSALSKVGILNRIPAEIDNWHHYGISRRVQHLQAAEDDTQRVARHDRRVTRLKWGVLAILAVALAAQPLFGSVDWLPLYAERMVAGRLEQIQEPSPAEWQGVHYLAAEAFRNGAHDEAERYFRALVRWRPDDPQAQNNLAWMLVTRPGADPAALREGLLLAERATEQEQAAYIWDTLAEAYFRLNQLTKAEAAADRALRLAEAGQSAGSAPLSYYRERWRTFTGKRRED